MSFKIGDSVKVTETGEFGRVTKVEADDVTYKNAWSQFKTAKASTLEKASGFTSFVANETPDIMEVAANSISFALINRATGKGFMSKENLRFLVEDSVYEFLLKGYTRSTVEGWIGVDPLSGDDMDAWFSSQDVKDAIVKSIPITVLDAAYSALMKGGKPGMSTVWFALKAAGAMTVANVAQRKLMTKGASYMPQ